MKKYILYIVAVSLFISVISSLSQEKEPAVTKSHQIGTELCCTADDQRESGEPQSVTMRANGEEHNATTNPDGYYPHNNWSMGDIIVNDVVATFTNCVVDNLFIGSNASVTLTRSQVLNHTLAEDNSSLTLLNGTFMATFGASNSHNITIKNNAAVDVAWNVTTDGFFVVSDNATLTLGANVSVTGIWANGTSLTQLDPTLGGQNTTITSYTPPPIGVPMSIVLQNESRLVFDVGNVTLSSATGATASVDLEMHNCDMQDGFVALYYPVLLIGSPWLDAQLNFFDCNFSGVRWDSGGGAEPKGPVWLLGEPQFANFTSCTMNGAIMVHGNSTYVTLDNCTLGGLVMDRDPWLYGAEALILNSTITNASMGSLTAVRLRNETRCTIKNSTIEGDVATQDRTNLTLTDSSVIGSIVLREGSSVDSVARISVTGNVTLFQESVLRAVDITVTEDIHVYHNATLVTFGSAGASNVTNTIYMTNDAMHVWVQTHESWEHAIRTTETLNITALNGTTGYYANKLRFKVNYMEVGVYERGNPANYFIITIDPTVYSGSFKRSTVWTLESLTSDLVLISTHTFIIDQYNAPVPAEGEAIPEPTGRAIKPVTGRAVKPEGEIEEMAERSRWIQLILSQGWYILLFGAIVTFWVGGSFLLARSKSSRWRKRADWYWRVMGLVTLIIGVMWACVVISNELSVTPAPDAWTDQLYNGMWYVAYTISYPLRYLAYLLDQALWNIGLTSIW